MEIIGFIAVMLISLVLILWPLAMSRFTHDIGGHMSKLEILVLLVVFFVGIGVGYLGIVNMPFEVTMK